MNDCYERASYAWTEDSVRLISTPSPFVRSALFYVQEIGHFRTLPSYFTEREKLDSYLVVYTLAGRGKLIYRGKSFSLPAGRAFFIDCMERHYYASDGERSWELLWVHLQGASMRAYYEQFAAAQDGPIVALSPDSAVESRLRELIGLHRSKSFRAELLGSVLLAGLLAELLIAAQQPEGGREGVMPEYVRTAMREIDLHYARKLPLAELADKASVSKFHLARAFKRYVGVSPGEYAITARMNRAKELLKYSDLPVGEIAAAVGIDNASHFIRLFRERDGHTPLTYRRLWQHPR